MLAEYKGRHEFWSRCLGLCRRKIIQLTYVGKAQMDVYLPLRQGLKEYVFDGGIGEFCNHKDETCDKSEYVCAEIFNMKVV